MPDAEKKRKSPSPGLSKQEQRRTMLLLEHHTIPEIAQKIGKPPSTVSSFVFREKIAPSRRRYTPNKTSTESGYDRRTILLAIKKLSSLRSRGALKDKRFFVRKTKHGVVFYTEDTNNTILDFLRDHDFRQEYAKASAGRKAEQFRKMNLLRVQNGEDRKIFIDGAVIKGHTILKSWQEEKSRQWKILYRCGVCQRECRAHINKFKVKTTPGCRFCNQRFVKKPWMARINKDKFSKKRQDILRDGVNGIKILDTRTENAKFFVKYTCSMCEKDVWVSISALKRKKTTLCKPCFFEAHFLKKKGKSKWHPPTDSSSTKALPG